MKQTVAILVTGSCMAMTLLTWNTPEVFGWVVASMGWLPHCLSKDQEINHG